MILQEEINTLHEKFTISVMHSQKETAHSRWLFLLVQLSVPFTQNIKFAEQVKRAAEHDIPRAGDDSYMSQKTLVDK